MGEPMEISNAAATEDLREQMSDVQIAAPLLDGLMKWHLYIGYSPEDREMVKGLHAFLKYKGLECKVRGSQDVPELSLADNIKQGIVFSHKCLLYISPNYLEDPNSEQELREAERKLKFLGKNSVFCIVQSNVDPTQVERYEQFQQISLSVDRGQDCSGAVQDCLSNYQNRNAILKDYELKMELQLGLKENIGVGVAYTYFFGFLQMVVPDVWEKFKEEMANSTEIKDENLVKKMLIIIRKSINPPPKVKEPGVEQTKFSIKQVFNRAGKERREYTLSIYKLTANDRNKNDLYFIADFPACLFALREVFDYELNTTTIRKDEVLEARNEFVLTVKALLSHPQNQTKFANQWELLLWPDDKDDKEDPRVDLSDFLHQQIESKRLTELLRDVTFIANPVDDRSTFARGRGIRDYPMYAEGDHYDLKYSNRGFCVIISNSSFLPLNLEYRAGSQAEIDDLEKLFEALGFKVCKHLNLTGEAIKTKLAEYSMVNHSESDAFVCCLLSHGNKGCIFGMDGGPVSVVELMELFYDDKCPDLEGKPKLFFIGACQSRESYQNIGTHSTQFMRDMIPPAVDFIISYAALPYRPAFRDTKEGGFYVQALCKYLTQDLEIDVALRRVNQEVRKFLKNNKNDEKQDPFHIIMPPQRFLFLKPSF